MLNDNITGDRLTCHHTKAHIIPDNISIKGTEEDSKDGDAHASHGEATGTVVVREACCNWPCNGRK